MNIDTQAREAVRVAHGELAMVDVPEAGTVVSKRRNQHRARVAAASALCALVVVGGAAAAIGIAGSNKKTEAPVAVDPVHQTPVQFTPVVGVPLPYAKGGCPAGALPDNSKQYCYRLGPPALEQKVVNADVAVDPSVGAFIVQAQFPNDDFVKNVARPYVGKQVAIVVDGEVLSAPTINAGIVGNNVQINGNFTKEEARALAAALRGVDVKEVPVANAGSTTPQIVVPEQKGLNIVQLGSTRETPHQFSSKDVVAAKLQQGTNGDWVITVTLTTAARQRLGASDSYFANVGSTMADVARTGDGFILSAADGTQAWSRQSAAALAQQMVSAR